MQRLVMPFPTCQLLIGYKHPGYQKRWGYPHFGIDLSAYWGRATKTWTPDLTVFSPGAGRVIAAGWDNSGGNVVVMVFPEVIDASGKVQDVTGRFLHLDSLAVKAGDVVKAGQPLGVEGATKTGDLHLEFDADTRWPCWSPQVSGWDDGLPASAGNIPKKGTDTTINPARLLHIGQGQKVIKSTYRPDWVGTADVFGRMPPVNPVTGK